MGGFKMHCGPCEEDHRDNPTGNSAFFGPSHIAAVAQMGASDEADIAGNSRVSVLT